METSKFKGLIEKLEKELKKMKIKLTHSSYYVFHDKEFDSFNEKEGISIQFDGFNTDIKKFTLRDYVKENKASRFLNSDIIASSYYLLTVQQKTTLMNLINLKVSESK